MIKLRYLAALGALAMGWISSPADAAFHKSPSAQLEPVIYYWRYLNAGQTYTFETNGSGDPVMHLLQSSSDGNYIQVASNDDGGAGLNSRISYTPEKTGSHIVFVRSYSTTRGGVTDLEVDGAVRLDDTPFGSQVTNSWAGGNWNAGDSIRVSANNYEAGGQRDPIAFALQDNSYVSAMDDDSGPNRYPLVKPYFNSSSQSRIVWGAYPGSLATFPTSAHLTVDKTLPMCFSFFGTCSEDVDGDALSNDFENAVGLNPNNRDGDRDGIPDGLELYGNNGFSMSEGGDPFRQSIFIEVDVMDDPLVNVPYADLDADMRDVFDVDGDIDMTVVVDDSITWDQYVGTPCPTGLANCTEFSTIKANNFSTDFARQTYFRYALFADRYVSVDRSGATVSSCSSGRADGAGQDFIVSLGRTPRVADGSPPYDCPWASNNAQQYGTTSHELGHNLSLSHNGNGNEALGNYSIIHRSIMSYRYQTVGVPAAAGITPWTAGRRFTYSIGNSGCAACDTSPKQRCLALEAGPFNCSWDGILGFSRCDCDTDEWGSLDLLMRGVGAFGAPGFAGSGAEQKYLAKVAKVTGRNQTDRKWRKKSRQVTHWRGKSPKVRKKVRKAAVAALLAERQSERVAHLEQVIASAGEVSAEFAEYVEMHPELYDNGDSLRLSQDGLSLYIGEGEIGVE